MTPWEGMPSILKTTQYVAERGKSEIWVHELNTGIERVATDTEKRSLGAGRPRIPEAAAFF